MFNLKRRIIMRITESAAYLKGLCEGVELGEATKEAKIINKMIDVISEMAARIDALEEENNELYACLEEISADLAGLEDDYYGIDGEAGKTPVLKLDENGEKVYYIEYAEHLKPDREEFYENGKVTMVDYDYEGPDKLKSIKRYENGEIVSTSAYTYYPSSRTIKTITTHDANGNLLEMRTNDTNGNLNEMLRYAYHANGALKMTEVWHRPFGSEILSKRTEYLENGSILLEEEYNFNGQIFKKLSYVYLQNGKLDYIVTEENGTVSYTYYRYGEDGTLLKTETVSGGSVT